MQQIRTVVSVIPCYFAHVKLMCKPLKMRSA